jgi:hypothetical protein
MVIGALGFRCSVWMLPCTMFNEWSRMVLFLRALRVGWGGTPDVWMQLPGLWRPTRRMSHPRRFRHDSPLEGAMWVDVSYSKDPCGVMWVQAVAQTVGAGCSGSIIN